MGWRRRGGWLPALRQVVEAWMTEAGELTGTHEGVVVWCMAARGLRSAGQAQRSHLRTAGSGAEALPPRIPTWDGMNPHLAHQGMAFGGHHKASSAPVRPALPLTAAAPPAVPPLQRKCSFGELNC